MVALGSLRATISADTNGSILGAVILLWRKAATKVIVFQDPSGTVPITLAPLGARPLTRAKFVLTAVSSMNTSRVNQA